MESRYSASLQSQDSLRRSGAAIIIDHDARRVLRNTWALLSLNLATAALAAGVTMALGLPGPGILLTLIGFYGLLFLVTKTRDSGAGVAATFALTGFMGYTLGPLLTAYLHMPNGAMNVMLALGGTAGVFVAMSFLALTTKRDLSFLGSFLFIGMIVAVLASLAAIFFHIPALSLAVSAVVVLLMSGMILFETNQIVRGGETNYVMATVSLFVSVFNLFTSLLQLLGIANRD